MNRNSDFTSNDAFNNPAVNMQHQFGGAFGGPIKKDRTSFFLAVEQNFLNLPFTVRFQPQPGGTTLPAALLALQGSKEGTNNTTSIFARFDHSLTSKHMLNVELLFASLDAQNFGLVPNDHRFEQANTSAPMIVITGVGTIGGEVSHPRVFDNTRYELTDNVSITKGRHSVRFGVDSNFSPAHEQRETFTAGRYDFKSLSDFNAGQVTRYRGTISTAADPSQLMFRGTQEEFGLFIQDKFVLTKNFTVNAGMRWDGQWNPQPLHPNPAFFQTVRIPNDLAMWQPRLGIAWDPWGHGATVIRASAGLYDARTPANLFQRAFTDNGLVTAVLDSQFDKKVLNFVSFPNALSFIPAGVSPAPQKVIGVSPDYHNPR